VPSLTVGLLPRLFFEFVVEHIEFFPQLFNALQNRLNRRDQIAALARESIEFS
jgi:hypothetical protein